ncbi:MAG: polysaccharide biosynthesis C-terminal domain-containing protein [Methanobrevibacter sp.]|nr:polysaccharide biosynthesis C-terminal domain-containing protein [Methanobrevibacter sp.]
MSEHVRDIQLNPVKSTIMLALPIIALLILNSFYTIIDIYWIDGIGTSAIICMGYISNFIYVMNNIGDGIGRSSNVLISNALGANEIEKTSGYASNALFLIIAISIIVPIISIPLIKPICMMANIAEYSDMIFLYIAPCMGLIIIIMINNFFSAILGSEGDTKRATIIIIAGNLLNIILDPMLIYDLNLGMMGAAIATILGSLFSCLLFIYLYSIKKDTVVKIHLKGFKFDMGIVKEIVKLTIPIILTGFILSLIGVIITYLLHLYASPVAAFSYIIILNIQTAFFTPIQGLLKGLGIVSGHLAGAKRFLVLKNTIIKIFAIGLALSMLFAIFLIVFLNPIVNIFSTDYVVMNEVRNMMIFSVIYMISFPIILGCSYVFLSLKKSTYVLMFLIFNLISLIVLIAIFSQIIGINSFGIFSSVILSNVIEALLMIFVLKRLLDGKIRTYESESEGIVVVN